MDRHIGYGWPMFALDTRWFDVAVVTSLFAVGSILFGRFEEHKPRWQRVVKFLIVTTVVIVIIELWGRAFAYTLLALPVVISAYLHIWWLPSKGVNGWTGEPRDRYLALMTRKK